MAIYAIGPEEKTPLKIGIAGRPPARLEHLQPGNWRPLLVHRSIYLGERKHALKIERIVHLALDDRRMVGEWFDVDLQTFEDEVAAAVVRAKGRVQLPAWPHGR
jgi:hypothetical protein